jgi:hypothetical protein
VTALTGAFVVLHADRNDRAVIDRALTTRVAQVRVTAATSGTLPTDGSYAVRLLDGTEVRAERGATTKFSIPVKDGFSTVTAEDGSHWRSWAETLKTGAQLQILINLAQAEERHDGNVRMIDLAVLLAALIAGLGTWLVAGLVLRPLIRMAAAQATPADPNTPTDRYAVAPTAAAGPSDAAGRNGVAGPSDAAGRNGVAGLNGAAGSNGVAGSNGAADPRAAGDALGAGEPLGSGGADSPTAAFPLAGPTSPDKPGKSGIGVEGGGAGRGGRPGEPGPAGQGAGGAGRAGGAKSGGRDVGRDQADAEAAQAVERAAQAVEWATQADALAAQANAKASHADERAAQANAKASHADERAAQANAKATQADERAAQAAAKASQADELAAQATAKATEADERAAAAAAKAVEAEARAKEMTERAERLQAELDRLRQADAGTAATERLAGEVGGLLREPLTSLGAELDQILDSPEMSSIQRHLLLAAIQNEHRRMIELVDELEARAGGEATH